MRANRAVTLVELLIVVVIFTLTFAALTPLVNKMKERSNIIKCSNNARMVSLGLHMYAADHDETFPGSLTQLYPEYIKKEKIFDCPAGSVRGTTEEASYEYISGLTESSSGTEVILYDKDGNHGKLGRNLVRVNGSVEWVQSTAGKPR
ncbi:MAG: prepilin-type N-terminal cleavage/methylation domain-containing protein [Candidatus Omnitrophota bacterium]|nr:prepilin-type N-terminal cleavage/methylation domain-containing protein [Candidatus Omnitrophota bacterium]